MASTCPTPSCGKRSSAAPSSTGATSCPPNLRAPTSTNASLRRSDLSCARWKTSTRRARILRVPPSITPPWRAADLSGAVLNDMALNAVTFLDKRITDRHSYNQDEVKEISCASALTCFTTANLSRRHRRGHPFQTLRETFRRRRTEKKTLGIDLRPEPAKLAKLTEPINRDVATACKSTRRGADLLPGNPGHPRLGGESETEARGRCFTAAASITGPQTCAARA